MALLDVLRSSSQSVPFIHPRKDNDEEDMDMLMSEKLLLPNCFEVRTDPDLLTISFSTWYSSKIVCHSSHSTLIISLTQQVAVRETETM